jgi:hypothetical protein
MAATRWSRNSSTERRGVRAQRRRDRARGPARPLRRPVRRLSAATAPPPRALRRHPQERRLHSRRVRSTAGTATPIMASRVTIAANASSSQSSVPEGRSGSTRYALRRSSPRHGLWSPPTTRGRTLVTRPAAAQRRRPPHARSAGNAYAQLDPSSPRPGKRLGDWRAPDQQLVTRFGPR